MKSKLLFAILIFSMVCNAQAPINSYYPVNGSTYTVVSTSIPLDQNPSGQSASWNFVDLTQIGSSTDNNLTPTLQEITTYPNTTTSTVTVSTIGLNVSDSKIYSKEILGVVSITGLINPQIELNFATNNALLGTFPLSYGYSNLDNLAGTFTSGNTNGNVTGTINVSVDAYGTLNLNIDGTGVTSYEVTRLKSIQNITMTLGFLGTVGTIEQTLHYYYINGGSNSPIFRSSHTIVNVPLQGINNEVYDQFEKYNLPLGVNQSITINNAMTIYPNPTQDRLYFDNQNQKIIRVTITDISGRIVFENSNIEDSVSLGNLQSGIYNATIETNSGKTIRKIVKK